MQKLFEVICLVIFILVETILFLCSVYIRFSDTGTLLNGKLLLFSLLAFTIAVVLLFVFMGVLIRIISK